MRIVIDDFGTAYASMSYLADFPMDGLRIDQQCARALDHAAGSHAQLVRAMVLLADALQSAEGVETRAQAAGPQRLGCRHAQGHLFSPAVPADAATRLLAAALVLGGASLEVTLGQGFLLPRPAPLPGSELQ